MARPSPVPVTPAQRRRSRKVKKEDDPRGRWLTTYADAVTLLMAFFVLLYSMSEIDVMKFTAFLEGLRVPFGNESGDGLLPETDGLEPEQAPVNPAEERPDDPDRMDDEADHSEDTPPTRLPDELQVLFDQLDPAAADQLAQVLDAERREQLEEQLDEVEAALDDAIQEHGLESHVEMRREERGLVVSIASDDILFALGSTRIDELGRKVVQVVSETLDGFPNPLFIEGHTDDVPLSRGGYTNWHLSADRAVAVLELMIDEHELPSDRVGAVGYGEYHPLASNDTRAGRARNRRVDIVVLVEEEQL